MTSKATLAPIDLASLVSGGYGLHVRESLRLDDYGAYRFPRPAELDVVVERHGQAVEVVGTASVEYAGACDRCLEAISAVVRLDVDERLAVAETGDPLGDGNVIEGGRLDLADLIRQLVDADLPYVARCAETCRGSAAAAART